MVLKMLWEVKTRAKVGRVVGSASRAHRLPLLPLGSDDGFFANYDLDDEMQGDAYNAQVDIDPYAGVPTRGCRTRVC